MKEAKEQYSMKEVELLYSQREEYIRQTNSNEKNCLILTGVIWGWLVTQTIDYNLFLYVSWFLPFIISVISALRVRGLNQMTDYIEDYLLQTENNLEEGFGWNNYLKKNKNGKKTLVGISAWVFWIAILSVTFIVPLVVIYSNV